MLPTLHKGSSTLTNGAQPSTDSHSSTGSTSAATSISTSPSSSIGDTTVDPKGGSFTSPHMKQEEPGRTHQTSFAWLGHRPFRYIGTLTHFLFPISTNRNMCLAGITPRLLFRTRFSKANGRHKTDSEYRQVRSAQSRND